MSRAVELDAALAAEAGSAFAAYEGPQDAPPPPPPPSGVMRREALVASADRAMMFAASMEAAGHRSTAAALRSIAEADAAEARKAAGW